MPAFTRSLIVELPFILNVADGDYRLAIIERRLRWNTQLLVDLWPHWL
jgi:hypothetical protein